ncbi:MAG: hypothetical protein LBD87_00285 [Prevotellaceae bacterium]|nr:hypothetical protein [Prevotellaceae bacterium]
MNGKRVTLAVCPAGNVILYTEASATGVENAAGCISTALLYSFWDKAFSV